MSTINFTALAKIKQQMDQTPRFYVCTKINNNADPGKN